MLNLKRYPGPRPFLYEDQEMFFGRKNETEFLTTLILNNKTTVLQGKSGYGKSSLINAGIIPNILSVSNAQIIKIRFYNYDKTRSLTPKDTLLKTLQIQQLSGEMYLEGIIPENHVSAWSLLKKLHVDSMEMEKVGLPMDAYTKVEQDPNQQATVNGKFETPVDKLYILVFDQFEELFTYPGEQVQEFGKELFDVMQNRIPEEAQQSILKQCQSMEDRHRDEISILNKELPVKMLFSIRSDRFNYLTYLKGYLPNFLNNTYKLRRMLLSQVREAIVEPAKLDKNYQCPPFRIEERLLQKIIDFLSYTKDEVRKVEIFEMQIICSKLEEVAVKYAVAQKIESAFLLTETIIAEYGLIKNAENFLSEFIQNYYSDTIYSIEEAGERLAARYFIEKKLIDAISKNRISLDYVFVQEIGICKKTLSILVDKKIIRVETNSVNGKSFEISHDSLVQPIAIAANQMGSLEIAIQSYVTSVLNKLGNKGDQQLKNVIYNLSEADQVAKGLTQNDNPTEYAQLSNCDLLTKVNYSVSDEREDNRLILKDAFRPVVQQISKRAHQRGLNELVKKYLVTFVVAAVVIIFLVFTAFYLWRLSNKYQGLVYIGFDVDSIKNKSDAVALTNYLYEKPWNDEPANEKIRQKLFDLVHSPDIQSQLSIYDKNLSGTQPKPQDVDLSYDGKYVVINDPGNIRGVNLTTQDSLSFRNASYAYFINNSHLVVAVYRAHSDTLSKGDSLRVYDMETKQARYSTALGKGRSLFPPTGYGSLPEVEYGSRRVRMTASGNFILPLSEKVQNGLIEKLGIWSPGKQIRFFNTEMSTSLSKDKRNIMIGHWKLASRRFLELRDENGAEKDTINDVYFGEFTPKGSVVYIHKGNLVLRNYDTNGTKLQDRSYWVNKGIDYAVVNSQETVAMARSSDSAFFIDLTTNAAINAVPDTKGPVIYAIPKTALIGTDLDQEFIYTLSRNNPARSQQPQTYVSKRTLRSNIIVRDTINKEISSFQYNDNRKAILIQTTDNMLYLFDADLARKTCLQLTANDLFQFSRNGNVFYYLLNNRLCIFENKKDMINLGRFESYYPWLQTSLPSPKQMKTTLARYNVKL